MADGTIGIGTADPVSDAYVEGDKLILYGRTYIPPSWSDGTDFQIVQALQLHYNNSIDLRRYWTAGQERSIELSDGKTVTYVLNSTQYDLVAPIGNITKCCFSIWPKYIVHNHAYGRYISTRITWLKSTMRPWANDNYKNMFPASIQGILKQFVSPLNANDYFFCPNTNQGIMTDPEGTPQRYWLGNTWPSDYPAEEYYIKVDGNRSSMSCSNSLGAFLVGAI